MPKLVPTTARKMIKILERLGFEQVPPDVTEPGQDQRNRRVLTFPGQVEGLFRAADVVHQQFVFRVPAVLRHLLASAEIERASR